MASLTQWTQAWETPGNGEGQGSLVCCTAWGYKESDLTERPNCTDWYAFCKIYLINCVCIIYISELLSQIECIDQGHIREVNGFVEMEA